MELQEWGKYFVLCVMGLIYAGSQVNTDLWLVDMMWYCPLIGPLLTGCPWSWQLGGGVRWQQPESHRYTDLRCALYLFITLHSWRSSTEILTDGGRWLVQVSKNAQFLSPFYFFYFDKFILCNYILDQSVQSWVVYSLYLLQFKARVDQFYPILLKYIVTINISISNFKGLSKCKVAT